MAGQLGISDCALPELLSGDHHFSDKIRKTRIVCTLGPASRSVEQVVSMLRAGMNVARFNFSHGTHEYHLETLSNVRQAMNQAGIVCGLMLDTKGPEIRTGLLVGGKNINLAAGQTLVLRCDVDMKTFEGTSQEIAVDYKNLPRAVQPGSVIKIDDGLIVCNVLECQIEPPLVRVQVQNSAELGQRKGVNLPGAAVDLPPVTEQDKNDLRFAAANGFDMVAASFMRNAAGVNEIREILRSAGGPQIKIVSKIENQEGLDNFDEILEASDGIMVARGDLGVEIPIQRVSSLHYFWLFIAKKSLIFFVLSYSVGGHCTEDDDPKV